MKKRKKIKILIFILTVTLIVLTIILVKLVSKNNTNNEKQYNPNNVSFTPTVKTQEEKDDEELKMIQNMNERSRMQYYIGKYIGYIQEKEYKKAYDLLYNEYKDTYFPNIEVYIDYIQEKYPFELIAVEYNNIERLGDTYILWVNVVDAINGNPNSEEKLEQNFVIRENGFNDFDLSFSK